MTYKDEVKQSMEMLAENDKVLFIGQLVNCWGCVYGTLEDVPKRKKIELPIIEDTQMGMSIGLALEGYIPVTIYPRMDFLIIAMNQLLNHLDKIESMSDGKFKPKVIIRTIVGAKKPLNPGEQHCQDYTPLMFTALSNINVYSLTESKYIYNAYEEALKSDKSSLIIEYRDLYEEK
jgi:pyruvate dehydrogenase E1 component beta subunit